MQSQLDQPQSDLSRRSEAEAETWTQIAPLLDGALEQLGQKDHDALVLRFFEGRNFKEVGAALGASEDAAKMRVSRALEKLRTFFAKRGVSSARASLLARFRPIPLSAPVALAKTVTALAMAKGAAASGSTLTLIQGALKMMAWTKVKTTVVAGAVVLLAAGTTTVMVKNSVHHSQIDMQPNPATEEPLQSESIVRLTQGKQWAMALIMFANRPTTNCRKILSS